MATRVRRDVVLVSNELEFVVSNLNAQKLIGVSKLDVVHDVNLRDVAELRISLARNLRELNNRLERDTRSLVAMAESKGGNVHGGSSIFADVSSVEPWRYRTTSLSETAARGFLDITSQQVILGINNEALGFELYNFYRHINPVLLALSASSPYKLVNGNHLEDTMYQSRRTAQYELLMGRYPTEMLESPELSTLNEYYQHLRAISDEVKIRLQNGQLDANWKELTMVRNEGGVTYSHYPFDVLEPHQIYWFTRLRPDFRNSKSVFALELRTPDLPITVSGMQTMNAFVIGLAYYITDRGIDSLPFIPNGSIDHLRIAGRDGLNASIDNIKVSEMVENLTRYAVLGLNARGYRAEASNLARSVESVLMSGGDATRIREFVAQSGDNAANLRHHLINALRGSPSS